MIKRILSFFLLAIMLCSCSKVEKKEEIKTKFTKYSFDWFDTVTTVTGYAESEEEFNAVYAEIVEMFDEYHKLYDIYTQYGDVNNLCTVNKEKENVTVDKKIIDLLEYGKVIYTLTGGETNIAMGSVLKLWHDRRTIATNHPEKASLPSDDSLAAAFEHTDIEKLLIDREKNTVTLADAEMRLDVGALAKGYATEMVARHLESKGISGYMLNAGGNVRTIGKKPDGSKWTVGIENPDSNSDSDKFLEYISAENEAVVISGSYQRFYIVDGKQYHHIIDKDTLMPSKYFRSVAVVCDNSALGDALSTGLFCMTYEEGSALVESLKNVEAMWLTNSGELIFSSGFKKYTDK